MKPSLKKKNKIMFCLIVLLFAAFGVSNMCYAECDNSDFDKHYEDAADSYDHGDYQEAIKYLHKARRICDFEDFYYLKGHCVDMMAQYEDAPKWYQKYIENYPDGRYSDKVRKRMLEIRNGEYVKRRVWVSHTKGKADSGNGRYEERKVFEFPARGESFPDKPIIVE